MKNDKTLANNKKVKEIVTVDLENKIKDIGDHVKKLKDSAYAINRLYNAPSDKEKKIMVAEAIAIINDLDLVGLADYTNIKNVLKLGECLGMSESGNDYVWVKSAYDVINEYYNALLTKIEDIDTALSVDVINSDNDAIALALYYAVVNNESISSDMRMNIFSKKFKIVFTAVDGRLISYALSNELNPIVTNYLPRVDTKEIVCPATTTTTFVREVIKLVTNK